MIGFRTSSGEYYVCGSQPYRKGMGCGSGVYVPRRAVEAEVCQGLGGLLNVCGDPEGFTKQVNLEIRRLWEETTGRAAGSGNGRKDAEGVEAKIANLRRAVEDGFADASWANARLRELIAERDALTARMDEQEPPVLDSKTVMAYRRQTEKVMASGHPAERKRLLRAWVQEVKLEPQTLEVKISYRLPEAVMKGVVAGACNAQNLPFLWQSLFDLISPTEWGASL
jgi:hypothetical protein